MSLVKSVQELRADLLLLAGDLFAADSEDGQRKQAQQIVAVLRRVAAPCFYLMGNDDTVSLDHEDEHIKPLHARRLACGDWNFVGYEYTPPFVGAVFVKPESEIQKDMRSLEPLLDQQTILVTHAPAYGTLDRSYLDQQVGSHSLASLLNRTRVLAHIHGHIRGDFGRDGNHFNVAAAGQRRAVVVGRPSLEHRVLQER